MCEKEVEEREILLVSRFLEQKQCVGVIFK